MEAIREYVRKKYAENVVLNIIEIIILGAIFFVSSGSKGNDQPGVGLAFIAMYVFVISPVMCVELIESCRREVVRGKLISDADDLPETGPVTNPWARCLPFSLFLSSIAYLVIFSTVSALGIPTLSPLIVCVISFVTALLITHLVLLRTLVPELISYQCAYREAAKQRPAATQPTTAHFFLFEFLAPWVPVLIPVLVVIGYKTMLELQLRHGTVIPLQQAVVDYSLSAFVVGFWMWLVFRYQMASSIALGKAKAQPKKFPGVFSSLVFLLLMALLLYGAGDLFILLWGNFHVSLQQALLFDVIISLLAGAIGCLIGIRSGKALEYRLAWKT